MSENRTPARTAGPMTVQGWLYLLFAVMVALVAIGTVLGADLLGRTSSASDRITAHIGPAQLEAYQLQATLVDQESGVRGYAMTADRHFLQPYTQGRVIEARAARRIEALLPDDAQALADLDRVERAAASWRREYAEPLVAGVTPGDPRPVDRVAANRGKRAFDGIRQLFDAQNAHLTAARSAHVADLRRARSERDWVLTSMVVLFLLTVAITLVIVRRMVIRPLDLLGTASRRVAAGDLEHSITEHGPADLRAVARDVESMRRRIMVELASSREQEHQLAEQAASLDAQALELRRSNEELEQFAYVASHDLQEPLRKVASFCQLLEKRYGGQLDERGQQYIDFAVDGAKRMQTLITDLLTFSRVGRLGVNEDLVRLDATLDKAMVNLAAAVEESGAQVERPAELPEIDGDPTLLAMLWQNLVGNAIKFRAADRVPSVVIECEPPADPADEGGSWLLSVTDNGIGIPPEFADKVFVIFQRLHNREAYSGTGIGLALCKKIVEHHGGTIWIDTSYPAGTRICFTLAAQGPRSADAERPEIALEGSNA